jgi:hypothetical protein
MTFEAFCPEKKSRRDQIGLIGQQLQPLIHAFSFAHAKGAT